MNKIYKLFVVMLLVCFTFFVVSCTKDPENQPEEKPVVDTIKVLEYQESLYYGDTFDENSVKVQVSFKDGTTKDYSGEDLNFDYTYLNTNMIGEQTVTVRIIPLNVTTDITVEVQRKVIKILMIANSFGDDTIQWVHEIAEELGYDFTITNLYIGGCTLETHLANLQGNKPAYEYRVYNKSTKQWSTKYNYSISKALLSDDWDFVSLQQGSWASGLADTYLTINTIMDGVLAVKSDVEFLWNMTWAYQADSGHASFHVYNHDQMTMYNAIINAVKTHVITNSKFKYIVPNGTAVQNARTSYLKDTLCRDVYCHLTLDVGRYIAGLTMVATVTGADIANINYAPVGVDALSKAVAIESVKNALANPYNVTDSKY